MLRLEKGRQQRIGAQQSLPRQLDAIAVDRQPTVGGVLPPRVGPLVQDLDAELVAEVAGVEIAAFQLQDHLADQAADAAWAASRDPAAGAPSLQQRLNVVFPLRLVLVVHARDVAEAGDAGGQQVGALPQVVAIAEVDLVADP